MKIEEKRKQFKLNSVTLDKIQKLKNAKELENPGIKIYEKDIVIQEIRFQHIQRNLEKMFLMKR